MQRIIDTIKWMWENHPLHLIGAGMLICFFIFLFEMLLSIKTAIDNQTRWMQGLDEVDQIGNKNSQ